MAKQSLLWAAAALACPAVIAGTTDGMENMIIRASRSTLPAADVGSSVSVVDRELIERRKPVFVTDLLQDLPGVAVSRLGGAGTQTQVRVRGAEANHVLVLIDGVEANDPAAADEFSFEQLTSWDIERIEVVRGPQSALWGSDAMAGVINIVTRRTASPRRMGGFAETGSYGEYAFGGHAGGNFGRGTVDFSASAFDTDGSNIARRGGENDGYENVTASLHGRLDLNDQLSWAVFGRYSDATSDFDDIDYDTGLPADNPLRSRVKLSLLRTTAELALLDRRWTHQLQFSYSGSDRDNRDGRDLPEPVDYQGDRYVWSYQSNYDFGDGRRRNRLTLAADYERDEYRQRGPLDFGDPNQNQEMDNTGLVVEYLLQPLGSVDLSVSARYDDNSDFDNATTWRLAGAWRIAQTGSRLHTSAGTGQKSPTFTERFGFFPGDFAGNPHLKPEQSTAFDAGIEQQLLDGRVRADLTVFYARITDEINGFVFDPAIGGFTAANEKGTSRRRGVETELRAQLTGRLDLDLSYTYTNAKQPDEINGGHRTEIRRPRQMAAANLNYRFWSERANLNLNLSYTGKQKDDYFPPPAFSQTRVQLDDYTLLGLVVAFDLGNELSIYGRAENLLDEHYENVLGYAAPGSAYYTGLRMRLH